MLPEFKEMAKRLLEPFGCTFNENPKQTLRKQTEYSDYVQTYFQHTTLRSHFPIDLIPLLFQITPQTQCFAFHHEKQQWYVSDDLSKVKDGALKLEWDLYGFQPKQNDEAQQKVKACHDRILNQHKDRVPCTALVDQSIGCSTSVAMTTYIFDGLYQNAIAWSIFKMGVFRFYPVFQDHGLLDKLVSSYSAMPSSSTLPIKVLFYVPEAMVGDDEIGDISLSELIAQRAALKETKLVDCLHQLSGMLMRYGSLTYFVLVPFYSRITPFSTTAYRLHYIFENASRFECTYDYLLLMKEMLQVYLSSASPSSESSSESSKSSSSSSHGPGDTLGLGGRSLTSKM